MLLAKWRPAFHLRAPHGWLNDPCGPGFDPSTGLYHVAFQWNPKGNDWGNMSWGHSTSRDLVSWQTSAEPSLTPTTEYDYDRCGIFTGCLRATDLSGKPGALTYIYTSVMHLPIHYSIPYVVGCESLSVAVSHDAGRSWFRQTCNPILRGSPTHLRVTGWRDPYLAEWPSLHMRTKPSSVSAASAAAAVAAGTMQRSSNQQLYGFLSGGIVGKTPTVFVYTVDSRDLRCWTYLGHLVDVGLNFSPSRWSGDFGVNWEVANLLTLTDDEGVSRDFVIMGTEGCVVAAEDDSSDDDDGCIDAVGERKRSRALDKRTKRQQLWMSIEVKPKIRDAGGRRRRSSSDEDGGEDEEAEAEEEQELAQYAFAGIFDHGCYYAANSFYDPQTDQHIVFGWITEEDLPDDLRHAQGWSGLISLPRVVRMVTMHGVVRGRQSELEAITSIEREPDHAGTAFTVRTLSIQPDARLTKLRTRASHAALNNVDLDSGVGHALLRLATSRWEAEAEFAVSQRCVRVGIEIGHDPGEKHNATAAPSLQGHS